MWSELESGENAEGAPPRPSGVVMPGLEFASWLDRYVDRLVRDGNENGDPASDEQRVDLMVGLSNAAEALRASERCDHEFAEQKLRSALELMRGIDLGRFALFAG